LCYSGTTTSIEHSSKFAVCGKNLIVIGVVTANYQVIFMQLVKAVRAKILLGDIELDVYQMPNGSYRLAGRNVTDAVGEPNNSLIRLMGVKSLKGLPHADSSLIQVKAETGESFVAIAIEDAAEYWGRLANKGNPKAIAVLIACAIESMERRADAAFGVKRSEEERNARFELRQKSLQTRRAYTDVLRERLISAHGEDRYKQMARAGYFRDVTVKVNLHLYGQPHFNCNRENMDDDQLRDIELFEKQLERRARRYPKHTAEQLLTWMVDQF
jgi:hypothetical protein